MTQPPTAAESQFAMDRSPIASYLLDHGWSLEPRAKLFVQVNHSDVLREFVRIAGKAPVGNEGPFLPRGR
jgi:hypothetical protein